MGLQRYIREILNSLLKSSGFEITKSQYIYEWQKYPQTSTNSSNRQLELPKDAAKYLVESNPRLAELRANYSNFSKEVTEPLVWTDSKVQPNDILYFRGDNAYVWQVRRVKNMNILTYALTTYYVKSIDKLGLLEKLSEDNLFGIYTFEVDNRLVSRDLLDSILEIYFLEKHLNISAYKELNILDIGAGYGRLAYRMVSALQNVTQYLCTDAFPISTFISEYYIKFRDLGDRSKVIPLNQIEHTLQQTSVDIAVNIHSFSECKISAIEWWLSLLVKHKIKNLMIIPNSSELRTNDGIDFGGIIEKHGYRLIAKESKYGDPVLQKYGVNPVYYYLFELIIDNSN
ncbi:MAG: putative sugar O-methyltransferase [Crocosphaera sp.]